MDKPLVLKMQEFKQKMSEVINASELPIYILSYQIKDLYDEIEKLEYDYTQKEITKYYDSLEEEKQKQEQNESEENEE